MRYYGGFGNRGMTEQRVFHFCGRNPHTRDFHHVVGAAAVIIIAIGVTRELVIGRDPVVLLGLRR